MSLNMSLNVAAKTDSLGALNHKKGEITMLSSFVSDLLLCTQETHRSIEADLLYFVVLQPCVERMIHFCRSWTRAC